MAGANFPVTVTTNGENVFRTAQRPSDHSRAKVSAARTAAVKPPGTGLWRPLRESGRRDFMGYFRIDDGEALVGIK